ncbi:MAG: CDP-alcohol phosphatidyltransferase family protein [Planctomycetes bacterium]|nr:CDP-alcohol phosphatidyltransferase family protein [Planctomycetota bacterium]
MSDYEPGDRRPIASRKLSWVKRIASLFVRLKISPNAISLMSVVFALAGAGFMLGTEAVSSTLLTRVFWIAAALCVQLRLLANMFDGMVALESGQASATGELFNELPDRVSDTALLVALGFVAGSSPHLGYAAALLAMFGAYLRAVGASVGAGQLFAGIMAKPQRMFTLTSLLVFLAAAPASWSSAWANAPIGPAGITLAVICLGCLVTAITRLLAIGRKLRGVADAAAL